MEPACTSKLGFLGPLGGYHRTNKLKHQQRPQQQHQHPKESRNFLRPHEKRLQSKSYPVNNEGQKKTKLEILQKRSENFLPVEAWQTRRYVYDMMGRRKPVRKKRGETDAAAAPKKNRSN